MRRLFALAAVLAAAAAHAQTTSADNPTLQKLLEEVRQLRMAMEKSMALAPRMQLLLQRAQMQEARVARISQQLEAVRSQIAAETARQTDINEHLAKVEQDISTETDEKRRAELEEVRKQIKMVAGHGPDQQLSARESELSNEQRAEQAVLDELNGKLDALERQLEAPTR